MYDHFAALVPCDGGTKGDPDKRRSGHKIMLRTPIRMYVLRATIVMVRTWDLNNCFTDWDRYNWSFLRAKVTVTVKYNLLNYWTRLLLQITADCLYSRLSRH